MVLRQLRLQVNCQLAQHLACRPSPLPVRDSFVSFCFDDFPLTAAIAGVRVLERAQMRGTFYFASALAGRDSAVGRIAGLDEAKALWRAGHEIGCHTQSHCDCTALTPDELFVDISRNRQALDFCELRSFAFPFGHCSPVSKRLIGRHFRWARTSFRGTNRGHVDLAGLRAQPIYGALGLQRPLQAIRELKVRPGWLILYTHDVQWNPSAYGCTPDMLEHCVALATQQNLTVLPVAEVAELLDPA